MSDDWNTPADPYGAPRSEPKPDYSAPGLAPKPAAFQWFNVYVGSLVVIYVFLMVAMVGFLIASPSTQGAGDGESMFGIVIILLVTVPVTLFVGAAPFLPREKWAWVYTLIVIAMGMGSCWMPLSLYLMIKWVDDPVKRYYGA